ncbi:XRE family transcriptional regulator [Providencia stuartii]|uniref:XRE family transcriptional regulator n=1 Tax=Providencia stuartii TaxID=588 RepID=UPI00111FA309|nr:XRE family transcriptional regulator [Providencia stuartii]
MGFSQNIFIDGVFDQFYPSNVVYTTSTKRTYFLGHTNQDFAYYIYNVNDKGSIEGSTPIIKGKFSSYLSNLQTLVDVVTNKQYIFGFNLVDKSIQFFKVLDTGNLEQLYELIISNPNSAARTALYYAINGTIYYYYQNEKTKGWEISKVAFTDNK